MMSSVDTRATLWEIDHDLFCSTVFTLSNSLCWVGAIVDNVGSTHNGVLLRLQVIN